MKGRLPLQKRFLALLVFLIMGMGTALAYSFSKTCSTGQTLYYNITDATNHYVELTYPGTSPSAPWQNFTKPIGSITLPTTVSYSGVEYTVTAVGNYAFYECSGLTGSLTFPNTVTTIGTAAFYSCTGFGSLTIPNTVITIGDIAFGQCSGFHGMLTIRNSVTTIGSDAFAGCSGFTSLSLPSSLTEIGSGAFRDCTGFTGQLNIPSSVTVIGSSAFSDCTGFNGVLTIPVSVTTIGASAFKNCSGFSAVVFNAINCANVDDDAMPFENCGGTLTIGNTVQRIPAWMFYKGDFTGSLTIPDSVTAMGQGAFMLCSHFTGSLTLSNSLTGISMYAFQGCSGFTGTLTIPNSVTEIGWLAFQSCSGFTGALIIPDSVTELYPGAFWFCSGFTSLTIGNSVTSINNVAFGSCTGLTRITVLAETPPTLGSNSFDNVSTTIPVYVPCSSLDDYQSAENWSTFTNMQCLEDLLTYSINDDGVSVTVTGHVNGTSATGPILIPETKTINGVTYTVTAIGDYAFDNCQGLTGSLTIPNTVTTIGEDAFNWCTGFNGTLTLGNSLTTIGEYAFYACSGFTGSLTIPNSVTTIDRLVFYYCTGFTGTLTLGNSLTSIGYGAFYNCSGLTGTLTLPSSLTTISGSAFVSCSGFTGALVIPDGVTTIGNSAFSGCSGLTSLIIPASVTSLGNYAFGYCEGLTTMTVLPATPPTLGNYVFRDVPTTITVYVPCGSLEDYQSTSGWNAFTNMQCILELTVYEGTTDRSRYVPAYIFYFDDFTRSQFVIPAYNLSEMIGKPINSMTFYTTPSNIPYTTVSSADVYLKEVDYTSISAFETKESATTVYSGYFNIVSIGDEGKMTINFSTPYVYQGGNLLVGIENTQDNGYKYIEFYGQTVSGASIAGSNPTSLESVTALQSDFIPKTTFNYVPSMCAPKPLPYTYGFEEEDEFDCWTMLNCDSNTGRTVHDSSPSHQGSYFFRFWYNTNPPQYLISPELECDTVVNMSFYYRNVSNNYPETFQVGYSTTTKSPAAFTWGDEVTATNEDTWMLYEDSFPEGTKYVAVKLTSNDRYLLFLDDFSFTAASPTQTQSVALASGANWFSTNLDITLDDLKAALVAAVPGTNITIKGQNSNTRYLPAQNKWVGSLNALDLTKMYIITVSADAEITLEGTPINPAALPVTIKNGTNWIAFPLNESMTLTDAFTGFAVNGDVVKGQNSSARCVGSRWVGGLTTLEPGEGYLYNSAASGNRTFTFPSGE